MMPSDAEPADPEAAPKEKISIAELMRGPFDIKSFSLTALLVLAVIYTIYLTRGVLLPIVIALLFSYLLAPLVRFLGRLHIPPMLGSGIVLASVLSLFVYFATLLSTPAASWVEKAPYSLQRLQAKLVPFRRPIEQVNHATEQIEKITTPDAADRKQVVEVKRSRLGEILVTRTPEFFAGSVTTIILLFFLLAYDGVFLLKLMRVIPRMQHKKKAVEIAREVEFSISRYLLTVTCINLGLGVAIGLAMFLLGMPNPILWGAMAATLNFIPYLGALTGIIAMTLAAILSFDSLGWALVFPGTYLAIATIEGSFITPLILGKSLTLNPVVIFISLMFWGWMWGIAGALLAVPILAVFKIFCDHVEPLAPIGEFLSD